MTQITRILGLFALLFPWTADAVLLAQAVKNPISDYLGQSNAPQNPFVINNGIQEFTLNVNGKNVTFISSPGYVSGKEGGIWTAYVVDNGQYVKVDQTTDDKVILFNSSAIYTGPVPELGIAGLLAYIRGSKDEGELWLYEMSGDGLSVKVVRSLDLEDPKDYALTQKYFGFGNVTSRSEEEHPLTEMDPDALRGAGYTLPAENAKIPIRRPDHLLPPEMSTANKDSFSTSPSTSNAISSGPTSLPPNRSQQPSGTQAENKNEITVWAYSIIALSVSLIIALWYFWRAKK